jgi:hypothetical protein
MRDTSGFRLMAHDFNIVTVWTNDEGGVVVGVVVGSRVRGSVVFASGGQSAAIELVPSDC